MIMSAREKVLSILRSRRFWKSVASGVLTAIVDLSLLFAFREMLSLSYWVAINTAFVGAILTNFSLQKFWTFRSMDLRIAHTQFIKFLLVSIGNMAMNNVSMFVLFAVLHVWYLVAQIITMAMLAILNFTLYQRFVFSAETDARM